MKLYNLVRQESDGIYYYDVYRDSDWSCGWNLDEIEFLCRIYTYKDEPGYSLGII